MEAVVSLSLTTDVCVPLFYFRPHFLPLNDLSGPWNLSRMTGRTLKCCARHREHQNWTNMAQIRPQKVKIALLLGKDKMDQKGLTDHSSPILIFLVPNTTFLSTPCWTRWVSGPWKVIKWRKMRPERFPLGALLSQLNRKNLHFFLFPSSFFTSKWLSRALKPI